MTVACIMLEGIYEHSHFANARLLDQAEHLTAAELDSARPGMYGTIRITLQHMMQAQQGWLRRVQELDPLPSWPADAFPTIADLRARWDILDSETLDYVSTLTDEQLLERIPMRSISGWVMSAPRWQALIHQAFHQHQHRGEVAMVLTNLGHSPGEIDAFDWFEAAGTALDITPGRSAT